MMDMLSVPKVLHLKMESKYFVIHETYEPIPRYEFVPNLLLLFIIWSYMSYLKPVFINQICYRYKLEVLPVDEKYKARFVFWDIVWSWLENLQLSLKDSWLRYFILFVQHILFSWWIDNKALYDYKLVKIIPRIFLCTWWSIGKRVGN